MILTVNHQISQYAQLFENWLEEHLFKRENRKNKYI